MWLSHSGFKDMVSNVWGHLNGDAAGGAINALGENAAYAFFEKMAKLYEKVNWTALIDRLYLLMIIHMTSDVDWTALTAWRSHRDNIGSKPGLCFDCSGAGYADGRWEMVSYPRGFRLDSFLLLYLLSFSWRIFFFSYSNSDNESTRFNSSIDGTNHRFIEERVGASWLSAPVQ